MDQSVNDKISQIVADLFSQPKPGEDWAGRMQHFRDEIQTLAEREQTTFGQFLKILESFRTIIPDERQRYQATIQALSATLKLNRDGLLDAAASQLAELGEIEKSFMPVLPGQRNALTGWDARAAAIRNEIDQLRNRIAQLENEEKGIVTYIAGRHQELEYVERSMQQIFAAISSEITGVKSRILEYTTEPTAAQPAAQTVPEPPRQPAPQPTVAAAPESTAQPASPFQEPAAEVPSEAKDTAAQTIKFAEPPALDPNVQKPCPMCGGVMNFQAIENLWLCYSCAYEESDKKAESAKEDESENEEESDGEITPSESRVVNTPIWPGESHASIEDKPEKKQSSAKVGTKKKTCPVCRMTMVWHPDDKAWRCRSCNYERRI